ncbi:hypothetical protein B7494_g1257 [Chlorociboria aeruginascens]|nr:hypothetical protein B7494_g1257 [Chlorociboria aeruginascens]
MDHPAGSKQLVKSRSRSNTAASVKSRKRPQSRASTTSAHSGVVQPIPEQQPLGQPNHWFGDGSHSQQRFESINNHMSPEEALIQSANQLQNPHPYDIDPALGGGPSNDMSYTHEAPFKSEARHALPGDNYGTNYGEVDSQILEGRSDEQDDVDSLAGATGPVKKSLKSSAANELEMRELFRSNQHRTLPEVASELHQINERGPQSERQRQVFAMLWINQVCDKGKGSVPRGRVYANYVSRCATEKVTVLNPASFGKLVRVLFPGLKTRRLGVRGESKYHYVNFSLKNDQPDLVETQTNPPAQSLVDAPRITQNFNIHSHAQYPADRAVFPSPTIPLEPEKRNQRSGGFIGQHSLYLRPEIPSIADLDSTTDKMPQNFRFASLSESDTQEHDHLSLPSIQPFVPTGTDPDSANALSALYRSHCTSLVECIRFCKEKTFFHLFTSFNGTLTMPVQKVLSHPSLAPWIEECDFVMYQKMMRTLAPLTLQVAPKLVLDTLRSISNRLVSHIRSSFHGQPSHVIEAKVAPATLFSALLDRELRVNLTAHAAANMLANPYNRNQMYEDWITMVRTRKVAECVPTRGMDDVVNVLLTELRDLLDPIGIAWEIEGLTPYGEIALRSGRQQQESIHADSSTENVLDRWVSFLASLPERFPYATHAEIVWCVQRVGTTAIRDITIAQGKSFGAWWVTKCWIDEMIAFMAEQGGFMECKSTQKVRGGLTKQPIRSRKASQHEVHYNSGGDEFLQGTLHGDGHTPMPRPMDVISQAAINAAAGHDDSGIGMRTPDDEFAMGKYNFGLIRDTSHTPIGSHELDRRGIPQASVV